MNFTWLLAQSEPSSLMMWVDKLARTPLSQVIYFALAVTVVRGVLYPYLRSTPAHKRGPAFQTGALLNELGDALVYAAVVVFLLVRPFGIQTFWIPSGSMISTLLEKDMIVANKFVYRFWNPGRGDIVVFEPPRNAPNAENGNVDYIKRLIGLPGDVVEVRKRELYINGKKLDEPYIHFTSLSSGFREVLPKPEEKQALYPDFKLVKTDGKVIPVLISSEGTANFGLYDSGQGTTAYTGSFPASDEEEGKKWASLPPVALPPDSYLFIGDNRNGSADGRFWGLVKREKIVGRFEFIWFPFSRMGRAGQ